METDTRSTIQLCLVLAMTAACGLSGLDGLAGGKAKPDAGSGGSLDATSGAGGEPGEDTGSGGAAGTDIGGDGEVDADASPQPDASDDGDAAGSGGSGGSAGEDGAAGSGGATGTGDAGVTETDATTACPSGTVPQQAYGAPSTFSGAAAVQIEGENYDVGGEGVSYHDTTCTNDGLLLPRTGPNEGVDVRSGCGNRCPAITQIQKDEWVEYTINVQTAGKYKITLGYSGVVTSHMHIDVDDVNLTGTLEAPARAFDSFTALDVGFMTLTTTGSHIMRWYFEDAGLEINWIKFTYAP